MMFEKEAFVCAGIVHAPAFTGIRQVSILSGISDEEVDDFVGVKLTIDCPW